jgi:hypothetical protein
VNTLVDAVGVETEGDEVLMELETLLLVGVVGDFEKESVEVEFRKLSCINTPCSGTAGLGKVRGGGEVDESGVTGL